MTSISNVQLSRKYEDVDWRLIRQLKNSDDNWAAYAKFDTQNFWTAPSGYSVVTNNHGGLPLMCSFPGVNGETNPHPLHGKNPVRPTNSGNKLFVQAVGLTFWDDAIGYQVWDGTSSPETGTLASATIGDDDTVELWVWYNRVAGGIYGTAKVNGVTKFNGEIVSYTMPTPVDNDSYWYASPFIIGSYINSFTPLEGPYGNPSYDPNDPVVSALNGYGAEIVSAYTFSN